MVTELANGGDLFDRLIEKAEAAEAKATASGSDKNVQKEKKPEKTKATQAASDDADADTGANADPDVEVETGGYTEADAQQLARKLLRCVAYMHDRGVVHGDLKPDNLLMTSDDDDVNFKLADFGAARIIPEAITGTGARSHTAAADADAAFVGAMDVPCGTPMYLAPEVIVT